MKTRSQVIMGLILGPALALSACAQGGHGATAEGEKGIGVKGGMIESAEKEREMKQEETQRRRRDAM